jgi:hypothetical protein
MKKQTILLSLSILASSMFFSCKQNTVKTEEKDYTRKCFLTSDTTKGALNVDIHVEIPVAFADKKVLDSIRATIISNLFGDDFIAHPNDSLVLLFTNSLQADYRDNNAPLVNSLDSASKYSFNNEHTVEGFSLLSDKKIYSYGIDRYVFMGGAHGLSNRNYFNFDLKTGKLITEKELYVANYQTALSELIKTRIIEESKEAKGKDADPIMNMEDTDFWTEAIKPNGNFYITDESINYVFNPYEIAPYYMGQTEVTIPFDRIRNILKPNSIVQYLVSKQVNSNK